MCAKYRYIPDVLKKHPLQDAVLWNFFRHAENNSSHETALVAYPSTCHTCAHPGGGLPGEVGSPRRTGCGSTQGSMDLREEPAAEEAQRRGGVGP